MTSKEKAEEYKSVITKLYSIEGRTISYISRLLDINRTTVSKKINEWKLEQAQKQHITPSKQKFINKNRQLIVSRFNNNVTVAKIAEELKINRRELYKLIDLDKAIKKAYTNFSNRNKKQTKIKTEPVKDLSNEIWKPILGYEHYMISNLGRVKSNYRTKNTWYILKAEKNIYSGRLSVQLYKDNKRKILSIARLVGFAFVKGYSDKNNTINHIDGNIENNKADNLEWLSQSDNNKHAYNSLNRTKVRKNKADFKVLIYNNKFRFKTVAAFARFLNKSETQTRRYIENPSKYDMNITLIK